jgi:hypothetical protein
LAGAGGRGIQRPLLALPLLVALVRVLPVMTGVIQTTEIDDHDKNLWVFGRLPCFRPPENFRPE